MLFNNKLFSTRQYIEISLASLLLFISISKTEAKPSITKNLNSPISSQLLARAEAVGKDSITVPKGKIPAKDGIYLYSQLPEADRIGQEYIVFEVRQDKVIGAFYLPQSEFSCFQGSLTSGKLQLTIANDPSSTPYSDSVAGQNSQQVATASDTSLGDGYEQISSTYAVELQNYYQLSAMSANDQKILATCKNNYQK
jgi:hypothetical protein